MIPMKSERYYHICSGNVNKVQFLSISQEYAPKPPRNLPARISRSVGLYSCLEERIVVSCKQEKHSYKPKLRERKNHS